MNCIHIIHESRRGNDAAEENNRGHNYQSDFVGQARPRLLGHGNIECRIVILLREFFHRRNIAIPLSYLLRHQPLSEPVLSFTKKCARNCLL